jgi:hypothetical protein
MFELRKSLSLHYLEDPQTNTPHSNTTGKNHVLKQEKKIPFLFLFLHATTQVNDHSVFSNFSSFHGGLVWVFYREDGKYPSCARFFGLKAFGCRIHAW